MVNMLLLTGLLGNPRGLDDRGKSGLFWMYAMEEFGRDLMPLANH